MLKVPTTPPYGGEFTGPAAFDSFFAGFGGSNVWELFRVHVDDLIESDKQLIARLTNSGLLKASGKTVVVQNLWLFEIADGKLRSRLAACGYRRRPRHGGLIGFHAIHICANGRGHVVEEVSHAPPLARSDLILVKMIANLEQVSDLDRPVRVHRWSSVLVQPS